MTTPTRSSIPEPNAASPPTPDRIIAAGARALGIQLSAHQHAALARHLDLIAEWTPRLRLTGARSRVDAARILVAEGLDIIPLLPETGPVADLGSGAGIPGVLAAVLRPDLHVALVEASRKKAGFLEIVVRELSLPNAEVVCARAETLGRESSQRARYGVVTARALAEVRVLAEYAVPLLRIGGLALFPKGAASRVEIEVAKHALQMLDASAEVVSPAPGGVSGVVVVRKRGPTPGQYPRRAGVAERHPI